MNYKHAYHAGNFADVTKHILLLQLLSQFSQKGKPYYALDAYAGQGLYRLNSKEAKATSEAKMGIKQLIKHVNNDTDKTAPKIVKQYLQELQHAKEIYDDQVYPGSPWWIANEATKADLRAEAFEAQASEYEILNYQLYKLPIGIHHRSAFEGIKAVIPPKEKRGLIFLDPPFEQEHKDFTNLVNLLVESYNKWPQGTYVLWYPLKNNEAVKVFHNKMKRTGIRKQLICELNVYPNDLAIGMNGTGMLIINPPWKFDQQAREIVKYLQPILQAKDVTMTAEQASRVHWLVKE